MYIEINYGFCVFCLFICFGKYYELNWWVFFIVWDLILDLMIESGYYGFR